MLRFGQHHAAGECIVTGTGLEGGAIYALSAPLRDAIEADGAGDAAHRPAPGPDPRDDLAAGSSRGGRAQSLSTGLRKAGLSPVAVGLVQEALHAGADRSDLGRLIKALPVRLDAPMGLARAISSAGGLRWDAVDEHLMLRARPGVFAAGEMLDWEAPTGGYLLQACFSTGVAAANGALAWLGCHTAGRAAVAQSR